MEGLLSTGPTPSSYSRSRLEGDTLFKEISYFRDTGFLSAMPRPAAAGSGDESSDSDELPSPGFTSNFASSRAGLEVRVRQPPAKEVIHRM